MSDDDTPSIRGAGPSTPVAAWLEGHGLARAAAQRWWNGRFGADWDFEYAECPTVKVGDKGEEALVCTSTSRTGFTRQRASTIVVRNRSPVVVLDVAVGLGAMDFPEAHHLDLALAFGADGLSAELRDRAPDGTILVEPASFCRAQQKRLDDCEAKLAEGGPVDGACPVVTRPDGTKYVARNVRGPSSMLYPATLHDCAGAKANFAEMTKEGPKSLAAETRAAAAYIARACAERGRYVWKGERFVRSAAADGP